MPIGAFNVSGSLAKQIFISILGTPDLHTHIRLSPICSFFTKFCKRVTNDSISVIELGCSRGIVGYELAKLSAKYHKQFIYTGIDINNTSINSAKALLKNNLHGGNMQFICDDATQYLKRNCQITADIILFVDIIEHVCDCKALVDLAIQRLHAGGVAVVSVPTPNYPRIFGRRFHEKIGHLVEGYTIQEIDSLFKAPSICMRVSVIYNTGIFAKYGCWLFYNVFSVNNKYLNLLKSLLLYPFRLLDVINSPTISCSMFTLYEKI